MRPEISEFAKDEKLVGEQRSFEGVATFVYKGKVFTASYERWKEWDNNGNMDEGIDVDCPEDLDYDEWEELEDEIERRING